jgi:hypothetical protein
MPYILKHRVTSQIWTDTLVNHYQLAYYGVKFWNGEEDARAEAPALLEMAQANDADSWDVAELSESVMKLCNVKLRNDPSYRVYLDDNGKPFVIHIG